MNMDLGSTVTLVYTGKLEDGTVFGYATEENPMVFQTGMDMAIDGFEKEILAMEGFEGEKKTFTVGQYDAYGEYLTFEVEIKSVEAAPENFVSEHEKRQHMKEQSKLLGGDQGESYR